MSEIETSTATAAPAATEAPTTTTATPEATAAPTGETVTATTPSFTDSIPEAYRDKGFLTGVDSMDSLMSKMDGLSSMKGKKMITPTAESSDEDWTAFNDEVGDGLDRLNNMRVPEAYEFSDFELPEGTDSEIFQASTDKFTEIAREAGLSNKAADKVRSEWLKHEVDTAAAHKAQLDSDFETAGRERWGDDYEAKVAELSPYFQKTLPEGIRDNMQDMPISQLIPMMIMAEEFSNSQKPDGIPSNPSGVGMSKEQANEKFSELRALARKNPAQHQEAFNEFQDRTRTLRNS